MAIAIGVRTGNEPTDDCAVRYLRIEGDRGEKLANLAPLSLGSSFEPVPGEGLERLVPISTHEYYDWPEISDLFPWIRSGCKCGRTWPIAESKAVLQRRWRELLERLPRHRAEALDESPSGRKSDDEPQPLLAPSGKLRSIRRLETDAAPEGYERYGYRSLDRQWIVADHRVIDRAGPDLWRVGDGRQVFLTTLTSTKLGSGPVVTVSPYVPDLDHFRGSYGAKNVMPLYRDAAGSANVTDGLLAALDAAFRPTPSADDPAARTTDADNGQADAAGDHEQPSASEAPSAEDLLAYVYGLGGTAAFSDRFGDQLAEAAGPVRIPMTADRELFDEAVALGRDLLWRHTWGERFAPNKHAKLPEGRAVETVVASGMPESFSYDPDAEQLTVGNGVYAPVSSEVWGFEVSGLKVLPSWLGYRMKTRKGRKSSDLDDIRPTRWTQSKELLLLLSILEHTVEVAPQAADLLDRIVDGPLIRAADLPAPAPAQRKPPKT